MDELTEDWESGPDAARGVGERPERLEARCLLVFGEFAEVVTAHHPSVDPLRVPAAALASELGVDVDALAGTRFTARVEGDQVLEARLA